MGDTQASDPGAQPHPKDITAMMERPTLNECITEMVRLLATRRRLTQTDLAAAMHVDKAVVTRAFQGKRDWRASEVDLLANFLDVDRSLLLSDPAELFGESASDAENASVTRGYTQSWCPGQLELALAA